MRLSSLQRIRHGLIRSRWKRWLGPTLGAVPYTASLLWLLLRGQGWVMQIMMAPLLMMLILGLLTWGLARLNSECLVVPAVKFV